MTGLALLVVSVPHQVISLAGELLSHAEELIRDGLHPSEILQGYKKGATKVCSPAFCVSVEVRPV